MNELSEQLNPELFDTFAVGESTEVIISKMRRPVEYGQAPNPELAAGNVLRRLCVLGGSACSKACQRPEGYDNRVEKLCADDNLADILQARGMVPSELLMVGVTADGVGFYDRLESYGEAVGTNSVGVRELAGYNAFFAKGSEQVALGARLADCGFAAIEFKSDDDETVRGFVHLTRPNLQGEEALGFEVAGRPAGCFEYFLHEALQHYGGELGSVKVRLTAAIKAENFVHTFSQKMPEDLFPGWLGQGLLKNTSNPDWQAGDPIEPTDTWEPQYREMLRWQIMRSGISADQYDETDMIDPADLELGHASNHAGAHGKMPDARDVYMVKSR